MKEKRLLSRCQSLRRKLLLLQIDMHFDDLPRSARYAHLASIFKPPDTPGAHISSAAQPELARAYWHLFQVPGQPLVQPYESVYLDGKLMGEAAESVGQCYVEAGLRLTTADEMPDHISIELAFMSFLIEREEAQTTTSITWRARQHRFLQEHITRWVNTFCEQTLAYATHPLFAQTAAQLKQMIAEDIRSFDGPQRLNRYPIIHIELISSSCTLCTLCVDNCRRDALTVSCLPETIHLRFNPARCNGCRACLRLCPENAITLIRNAPQSHPQQEHILTLFEAPRVTCPNCQRPHIALPWLERLAEQLEDGESMRASLELCPVCKVNTQEENLIHMSVAMESITYG